MQDVSIRSSFDVGADAAAFRQLTLEFAPDAPYDVFINGQPVGSGEGSPLALALPSGLLRPAGNVMALAVHPTNNAAIQIAPKLGGAPDPGFASSSPTVVRGPWLQRSMPDGITIVWETDRDAASTAVVDGIRYDGGAGAHHVAVVTGLAPSHSYPYHVETAGQSTPDFELQTAPADNAARVRFVVFGDNRSNGDAHRRVADAIAGESPDFVVNTGDLVASSTPAEWQMFFDIEYSLLARVPLYPAMGNHEDAGDGRFAELFPLGAPESFGGRVYGLDFGAVHVAVLDSNQSLADQTTWLDDDLGAAEARGAKHLFIAMHWGPYSSGENLKHGSNDEARHHIVPLARKHRVDAIFAGHDHFYERGNDDGLTYFVTGGGGAPLYDAGEIEETAFSRSVYHYVVVDVVGSMAQVTAKDTAGVAFDSATLTR